MEKKGRISLLSLVVIVIVVLLVGIVAGYFITNNLYFDYLNKKQTAETKEMSSSKVNVPEDNKSEKDTTTISSSEAVMENKINSNDTQTKPEYDGSKSITINGKSHTISYINSTNSAGKYITTIYMNDKKIRTFKYDRNYDKDIVELIKIKGDKDYVGILTKIPDVIDENYYLMIVNDEEELINTTLVKEANLSIVIDGINCYKIYENHIIFFRPCGSAATKDGTKYAATEYKMTVQNDKVIYELERLCTDDEVTFAGK